eukprot:2563963-Rhodomonas_salina.1
MLRAVRYWPRVGHRRAVPRSTVGSTAVFVLAPTLWCCFVLSPYCYSDCVLHAVPAPYCSTAAVVLTPYCGVCTTREAALALLQTLLRKPYGALNAGTLISLLT